YKTSNSRTVYGSGAVMPDIFVPRDSLYKDSLINLINQKNILYRFAVQYTNKGRKEILKQFENSFEKYFKEFDLNESQIQDLEDFAKKYKVEFSYNDLNISEKQYIYTLIKSNIARLIWDNSEFYQCLNENDPMIKSAIEVLKTDKIASILEKN